MSPSSPLISVLLITARSKGAYATVDTERNAAGEEVEVQHPERAEWHAITHIIENLEQQTFKSFEFIVVTPLPYDAPQTSFPLTVMPPRDNIWTRNRKVAICTQRNSGIAVAKGELIVNLDDCCILPPQYLEVFATGWAKYGICAAVTWPKRGDHRRPQIVDRPGLVFGFGAYPREAALELGGYDEAYDGAQALEDIDWSTRLFHLGVKSALVDIPGFDLPRQTALDPRAVDPDERILKCCNAAWETQRVWRQVRRANTREVYTKEALERLVPGPCHYRSGDICLHHRQQCAYLDKAWLDKRHPLVEEWMKNPPIFDLRKGV